MPDKRSEAFKQGGRLRPPPPTRRRKKVRSRGEKAGLKMADALCEWAHLFYNHKTALRVLGNVIKRIQEHIDNKSYIPVPAKKLKKGKA